jgi:carboxypeptidase Taq
MDEKLQRFKEMMAEVADLNTAAAVLDWDQQVNMPPGGMEARGNQLATLGKLAH